MRRLTPVHALAWYLVGLVLAVQEAADMGFLLLPLVLAGAAVAYAAALQGRGSATLRVAAALVLIGLGFINAQSRWMERSDLARALVDNSPTPLRVEATVIERHEAADRSQRVEIAIGHRYEFRNRLYVRRPFEGQALLILDPGEARPLRYGDRLRIEGRFRRPEPPANPGAFDTLRLMKARGIDATVRLAHGQAMEITGHAPPSRWMEAVHALRDRLLERMAARRATDSVLAALVLGEKEAVDRSIMEAYQRAGVSHVLVVSGLHLTLAAAVAVGLLIHLWLQIPPLARRINPLRYAALPAAVPVGFYAMLTGFNLPVQRALIMLLAAGIGHAIERPAASWNALAFSAWLLLIRHPLALGEPSFLLSFGSVATLLAISDPLRGQWLLPILWRFSGHPLLGRLIAATVAALITSAAITLATAPLTVSYFESLPPLTPLANLLVVPLTNLLVLPLGLAGSTLEALRPGAGAWLWDAADFFARPATGVARFFAAHPLVTAPWPQPRWPEFLLAGCTGLLVRLAWHRPWQRRRWIVSAAASAVLCVFCYFHRRSPPQLTVTTLDVGQGEALVIEGRDGEIVLVDTAGQTRSGQAVAERTLIPYLSHRKIRRADAVILSHAQLDHAGGIAAWHRRDPNSPVWIAGPQPTAGGWSSALAWLKVPIASFEPLCAPARKRVGKLEMEVLYPFCEERLNVSDGNPNNRSLVARLCEQDACVLLTGDIEAPVEARLVEQYGARLSTGLLKAPHHGSRTSSTEVFLEAVDPSLALISAGERNRFGHPHSEVLRRYSARGIPIRRTDEEGAIRGWREAGVWKSAGWRSDRSGWR